MNFGIDINDLRLPIKDGLRTAAQLRFRDVELNAAQGEIAPENLSSSGRRHLARFVESLGLNLGAVAADLPGLRLTDPRTVEQRVARTLEVIKLAKEARVPIVAAATGPLTHPETAEPSPVALEALATIGDFADSCGVLYALRPAHDAGDRLAAVLDALKCAALKVCLDPAAMVMVGANPLASIDRYIESVALFHARDATAGVADRTRDELRVGHETLPGEGDVDFVGLLEALKDADYRGPRIIRRTDSRRPLDDIQAARQTLSRFER